MSPEVSGDFRFPPAPEQLGCGRWSPKLSEPHFVLQFSFSQPLMEVNKSDFFSYYESKNIFIIVKENNTSMQNIP